MKKLKFINKLIYLLNNFVAILLLLSLVVPRIKPTHFSLAAVLGLLTPSLIAINAFFVFYWVLIGFRRQVFLSGFALLLSLLFLTPVYKFSSSDNQKGDDELSILTYNVRKFNIYNWIDDTEIPSKINRFIESESPSVVVLQEYKNDSSFHLNYPFQFIPKTYRKEIAGYAFYSKYPIVHSGEIDYLPRSGRAYFADIKVNTDTVRIVNFHLSSLGIIPDEEYFGYNDSKKPLARLSRALKFQKLQVERIKELIDSSEHKVILAGDLNNTAYSWVYKNLKGPLQDSFLKAGNGFGKTYNLKGFPLRIDYILVDPKLKVISFQNFDVEFSDHYPILAKVVL